MRTCTLNLAFGPRATAQLTRAGAVAAAFVGVGTIFSSYAFGGLLMAFFVSCSLLSRLAGGVKARLDAEYKKDGQRDWVQVMCNGAVPTALALLYGFTINWGHVPFLHGCVASQTACQQAHLNGVRRSSATSKQCNSFLRLHTELVLCSPIARCTCICVSEGETRVRSTPRHRWGNRLQGRRMAGHSAASSSDGVLRMRVW